MSKILILHVGTSKAGSTAIQEFMAANRTRLIRDGVAYFPPLRAANHAALAAAFCTRPNPIGRSLGVMTEADRDRLRRWLARRINRTLRPDSVWLASSEHLARLLRHRGEISALRDYLCQFFDEVRIVAVLRRADYWLPSSYAEFIKAGGTRRLDAGFVGRRRRTLDQPRLLARWQRSFDGALVQAVPFLEADKQDVCALPQRVLTVAGLTSPSTSGYAGPQRLNNESIGAYATEVLRLANPVLRTSRLRPVTSRRRAVQTVARRWPGPATVLTPEAADAVERAGWLDTGIEDSRFAVGDRWQEWVTQPPAPTQPQTVLSQADRHQALAVLRQAGLILNDGNRNGDHPLLDAATTAARRAALIASRLF